MNNNALFEKKNTIEELINSFFNYALEQINDLNIFKNNLEFININNSNENSLQLFYEYENDFNEIENKGNENLWRNDYFTFIEKSLNKNIEKTQLPE